MHLTIGAPNALNQLLFDLLSTQEHFLLSGLDFSVSTY